MFELIVARPARRPLSRFALCVAASTHALLIAAMVLFHAWEVEAVTPPMDRVVIHAPLALPVELIGSPDQATRPEPARPRPRERSTPRLADAPLQPIADDARQLAAADFNPQAPASDSSASVIGSDVGSPDGVPELIGDGRQPDPNTEVEPSVDHVYAPGAVDVSPASFSCPPPAFPALARQMRLEGEVVIEVLVGADGRVEREISASGHPILVAAARSALAHCQLRAARVKDRAVRSYFLWRINFKLR